MELRITKYDPKYRRSDGTYARSEWTSFSDIGKVFDQTLLDYDTYLYTENNYVSAITTFFDCSGVQRLTFDAIEAPRDLPQLALESGIDLSPLPKLELGAVVSREALPILVRLALREFLWCKLYGESASYLHFGYDFYVYVAAKLSLTNPWKPPAGIFAEHFVSPYQTI